MPPNRNLIIIGGGVGPAASVTFHQKIVEKTKTSGRGDQGHVPVVHLSMSPYVLDRTKFLLDNPDGQIPNPGISMGLAVRTACQAYDKAVDNFIVGVPCNTFHSPAVYQAYSSLLDHPRIRLINMVAETAANIQNNYEDKEVILLSTTGTRDTKVYDHYFGENSLNKCNGGKEEDMTHFFNEEKFEKINDAAVKENQQGAVMAAIYDRRYGIKASLENRDKAKKLFECVIRQIITRKNEISRQNLTEDNFCVIMGCTEIPLAYTKGEKENHSDFLIDPMDILADRMIEEAGYPFNLPPDENLDDFNKENAEKFTRSFFPLSKL